MRARLLWLALAAVAGLALVPAAASAAGFSGAVRAEPTLHPKFRKGTPDYFVRCREDRPVEFEVRAPDGNRVAVGGGDARGGKFVRTVRLAPGRAVRLRFVSDGGTRTYVVRCLPADFRSFRAERHGRPQAQWYLVTPDLHEYGKGYAAVFDNHGVPIWWMKQTTPPFDMHLLPDGKTFAWTNWALPNPSKQYQARSLDGRLVRYFRSPTDEHTNQHELQVQPDGSAFLLTYPPRDGVDLRRWGGPRKATVLDGEVQYIDPQGKLVWRWNSADHLRTAETTWFKQLIHENKPVRLPDGRDAYDIVHINSIELVGDHHLVLSMRHTDSVYMIDRRNGAVVWKLGGTKTKKSLEVRGDSEKQLFDAQHDARMAPDGRTLTVFDNGTRKKRRPRILRFKLNMTKRIATVRREVVYRRAVKSTCCGSTRRLPKGNYVTSWGNTPFVTEQTPSGRVVLLIVLGKGSSYRVEPVLPGILKRSALRRGMDAMAPRAAR